MKHTKPQIGQTVMVYGVECEIVKVRAAGTVDVAEKNGPRAWRITGLAWSRT